LWPSQKEEGYTIGIEEKLFMQVERKELIQLIQVCCGGEQLKEELEITKFSKP
jgi:hypothetical protein